MNYIFDTLPIALRIIGFGLLALTIYCCYEAYYKIRKNKGFIYIAIVCCLLLLPRIIKVLSPVLLPPVTKIKTTSRALKTSMSADSTRVTVRNFVVYIPLVELFLLLAVLKLANKDKKNEDSKQENASDSLELP